jgi:hypothetical protein
MHKADRHRLLHAPYHAPSLKRGDRASCQYRDCDVVITSWTDARISWPRCRAAHHRRSGPGLLVNEELLRAIRTESEVGIMHWFGVSAITVWKWRKAFGILQWGTEGSRRLHKVLSEAGAEATRGQPLSPKQVEQRREQAINLNLGRYLKPGYHGRWWTRKELALLGTSPDNVVARLVGRTTIAVRLMRTRLGISAALARRRTRKKRHNTK